MVQGYTAYAVPMPLRAARALRGLSGLRGWRPFVNLVCGPSRMDKRAEVPTDAYGATIPVRLSSWVEWNIYAFGGYETGKIDLFRNFTASGGVLLDIGANIGNHALALHRHFDQVHCFEPNPPIFERLKQNIARNRIDNITAVCAGAGSAPGEMTFYQPSPSDSNQGTGTFVKAEAPANSVETVLPIIVGDQYVAERISRRVTGIKIDVQGFEPHVLEGLRSTIETHRPTVWIEVTDSTRASISQAQLPARWKVRRFSVRRVAGLFNTDYLAPSSWGELRQRNGDYLISPN